jgi:hypothetical protein
VFRVNKQSAAAGKGHTRFGRALYELNIDGMCANTPAPKRRVERAHQTLQDRLVKELRLQRISTVEVFQYPDGRIEVHAAGLSLPYSTYNKVATIDHGDIVDNKRMTGSPTRRD